VLFNVAPITDEYKKGPMEGRALYLDAQATTPLVSPIWCRTMQSLPMYARK